ncbi:carbohydrate-binding protein [Pseudobacteroides cellulosolvens]|uniref:Carbohydrate binding family 6 n=1 Tax=Pseudobacteroides cellulosolvens ATCC 35603 = DSM 2933 TaxID=398512 RepID=A0A0L6JP57_9FIRM|nr:carbohydrate-binding protein [Pseudobacteroides cellulosolvens]KNY27490.1 Carbohydrate binding family 6 [Pseudobacteroides cellulosolvens ATCC 35603 = DSM 2933]
MSSNGVKKCISVITLAVFLVTSIPAFADTASTKVSPYCTRTTTPIMSINLGGSDDVGFDGTTFIKQNSINNFTVMAKEPEFSTSTAQGDKVNALTRIEAETLTVNNGLTLENCQDVDGGQNLAYIGNGDYAGYDFLYFPKGTKGFAARVSTETEGGNIEVRLDHPGGELVGKCNVKNTGGYQKYVDVSCGLTGSIEGLHKVFLIFTGERDNGICNINWFKFTKGVFDPIKAKAYDTSDGSYYLYKSMDFGTEGPAKFKARLNNSVSGSFDIRVDSPTGTTICTINPTGMTNEIGCVESPLSYKVTGIHDLYLVDNSNGSIINAIDWFAFDPFEEQVPQLDDNLSRFINTSVKGYNIEFSMNADRNSVYEVYLYTPDTLKENKQVFDVVANGAVADTVDSQKSGLRWEKKGPYLVKVSDDGRLTLNCIAKRGMASISGIRISKVSYSKAFSDVKISDWFYIQVMELASKGVIFGKGNNTYKPKESIIGEHVAYMAFNVMKYSIAENDSSFRPEDYTKISDIPTDFWAYQYMKAYYNYFFKEKMSKIDINTRKAFSSKDYQANKNVRREEFAMAIVGARRLDYNKDGKVFVLDPDREPGAKLNNYRAKDYDKITDSFKYFIELALEKSLMKGDQNGNLNPKNPVNRAEAASFIYNALKQKENNFIKPDPGKTIQVPRITMKKRKVNVGILTLPAPAWDSINNKQVNDPNPDFTMLELLDRNINKPMDWELTNPYPPAYNKYEFVDTAKFNTAKMPNAPDQNSSTPIHWDPSTYFKDLRSIAKAQTDLEADMTDTGVVGNPDNIAKSKLFKYWEVSLDDPNLTPEKLAKSYDVLYQASHGKITYSADIQNKMRAFLNAGGQLWWENCLGLEIKAGDGFTDEVGFVSLRPGNNYKYAQVPVYNEGKMHPLFDNIFTIDSEKSSRAVTPGLMNKNSEISMLGDGEEWLNDDNRHISSLLPTDEVILNIQETNGTLHPNMAVRNVAGTNGPAGRIVITTNDVGCGITKHVVRSGGKAVEDYKFCYNLIGWMSKVSVNFDDTNDSDWNGKDNLVVKATVANNGSKAQTYDLTPTYNTGLWEVQSTSDYKNIKAREPWILSLDAKGYPNKIKLEPNQSEEIVFKMNFKTLDSTKYEFTLRANESGVVNTRDMEENTFVLHNVKIVKPALSVMSSGYNGKSFSVLIGTDNLKLNDIRPVNYDLTLKLKKGNTFVDPRNLIDRIEIDTANAMTPVMENMTYSYTDSGGKPLADITINNVKFDTTDQKVKINVYLKSNASSSSYVVTGKLEAFDPITKKRLGYSDETAMNIK